MNFIENKRDRIFSDSLPHQSNKSKVYDICIIIITEHPNTLDFFSKFTRLVMQKDLIFIPIFYYVYSSINPLTPNDTYRGRTAPLTSKRCSLYIYSTKICTEYFKHAIYSSFFPLKNAVCFVILTYLVPVLFTFYIQGVLKLKILPAPKD